MTTPPQRTLAPTTNEMPEHPLVSIMQGMVQNDSMNPGLIRHDIREALDRWGAGQPYPTGDFLEAVLTNDLERAVGRADPYNLLTLPAIVAYVVNNLPVHCYGSPRAYEHWMERERNARQQHAPHPEPVQESRR